MIWYCFSQYIVIRDYYSHRYKQDKFFSSEENIVIPFGLGLYQDNSLEYCCLQHFFHKYACIFSLVTDYK